LRLLQTPDEIYVNALAYLRIIFLGIMATAAYNILAGVLRAVGDSVTPLIFLIVSTVLNTILDILFVLVWGWGIESIAFGTVLSQTVSATLCAFRIKYMSSELHVTPRNLIIHRDMLPEILRIGLPAGIQQVTISLGNMAIQSLINTTGVSVIAGWVAFTRIDTFTTMPLMTVSTAVSILVGQNIGARNLERMDRGIKGALILAASLAAVTSTATLLFARSLIGAFIPGDTEAVLAAVQSGIEIVWRIVPFYVLLGIQFSLSSVLRGAGEAKVPMFFSILSMLIIRMPLSYLLYNIFGVPSAIFWAAPISWSVGVVVNMLYYYRAKWRVRALERVDRIYASKGAPSPEITEVNIGS
jgi:putative MATE family efflux protein